MRRAGVSKPCVWRWQAHLLTDGMAGLRDKTRLARILRLPKAGIETVVTRTPQGPPLPQRRRARSARAQGDPWLPRQLRRPQARQGGALADPASALDPPLHPDRVLLTERDRDPVRQDPLARRQLKRGVFPSVVALQEAINGFVGAQPRPRRFVRKANPKAIVAAAKRGHRASDFDPLARRR
jgi:hypothetical protein